MATLDDIPFADWLVPAVPFNDLAFSGGNGSVWGILSGMQAFTEGAARRSVTHGSSVQRGRHVFMAFDVEDAIGTTANGVWLQLWTDGDSDLAAKAFHASGQKLQDATDFGTEVARANQGLPSFAAAGGYMFHADGKSNMPHPSIADPDGVVVFDGVAYTDITSVLTDDDKSTTADLSDLVATPDALYIGSSGAGETFGAALLRLAILSSSTSSPVFVGEYWNGAWTALTVTFTFIRPQQATDTEGVTLAGPVFIAAKWDVENDWAVTDEGGNLPFSGLWVRFRGGLAGGWADRPDRAYIQLATSTVDPAFVSHLAGAAYHISDDPGNQTPDVISWGLDNWWSPVQNWASAGTVFLDPFNIIPATGPQGTGAFDRFATVYRDDVRSFESRVVGEFPIPTGPNTGFQFNVIETKQNAAAHVRVYFRLAATKLWYQAYLDTVVGSAATVPGATSLDVSGADTMYVVGISNEVIPDLSQLGSGPHYGVNGNTNHFGNPIAAVFFRDRVYTLGGQIAVPDEELPSSSRLLYSASRKPMQFPDINFEDIDADDGGRGVGLGKTRDVLAIFKDQSTHFLTGEPPNHQIQRVNSTGCKAPGTIATIHNRLVFLADEGLVSMDGAGTVTPIPDSEPVRDLIRGATQSAIGNAVGVYFAQQEIYVLALPGIQAQLTGGAGPGPVINDGCLVWHVPSGQWTVWAGIYAASFAIVPKDAQTTELWYGDYWGRFWRFTDDVVEGQVVGGVTYSGTATGGTSTTLSDTAATFLPSVTDKRLLGQWLWVYDGTGAGQVRKIIGSETSPQRLTVSPAWTTPPDGTSLYAIGHWYVALEFGDWDFGAPDIQKELHDVIVHLDDQLTSPNSIDAAIDRTDKRDTSTGFVLATGTMPTDKNPAQINLPPRAGFTQRLRLHSKLSTTRWQLRALTLIADSKDKPLG